MNETNILADVAVPEVVGNFASMYQLQLALQRRLNCLPTDTTDYRSMAHKSIYWGHCIHAELEELREWLVKQADETWIKEMQMEAIDVVHFVFNIGVEAGYTEEHIFELTEDYEHQEWLIESQRVQAATAILSKWVIEYVNLLPWKNWKTYKDVPDQTALFAAYSNIIRAMLMLCNACNLSKQGIINMYFAKNKVNIKRQDDGY
jgi:dimeric dUTPase (all-alpha-NTP-PPase superfamily)